MLQLIERSSLHVSRENNQGKYNFFTEILVYEEAEYVRTISENWKNGKFF